MITRTGYQHNWHVQEFLFQKWLILFNTVNKAHNLGDLLKFATHIQNVRSGFFEETL